MEAGWLALAEVFMHTYSLYSVNIFPRPLEVPIYLYIIEHRELVGHM